MSKFIKLDSTLTEVTSFSGNFDHRELSARPEFTQTLPLYDVTLVPGLSNIFTFEGYNLDSVESVLLSSTDNTLLFTSAASTGNAFINFGISGFTSISTLCAGAVLSPAISGLLTSNYTLNSYNNMSVTFSGITASGSIDVIPMNAAGYGSLVKDLNTTITIT